MQKITAFCFGCIVYHAADEGLAKFMCLETLRHGTNPISNLWIRVRGGLPSYGGGERGSTHPCHGKSLKLKNCESHFYIFKDTEFSFERLKNDGIQKLFYTFTKRLLPRVHATLAGVSLFSDFTNYRILNFSLKAFGGITSFFLSPTLRFRFSKIDAERLENDPDYGQSAYRTRQIVEPWRLGILGSILTGVNFSWFSRVKNNPQRVLIGAILLASSAAIARYGISTIIKQPRWFILGAILV